MRFWKHFGISCFFSALSCDKFGFGYRTESRRTVISPSIRMMDSELERNKRGTAESVIDSLIASGTVDAYTRGDLIMRKRQKLIGYFSVCFF